MTGVADYFGLVTAAESPDGRDNDAGSGAFSKFQFMPATASSLAQRTAWGRGATPATIKALVQADPTGGRAKELMTFYTGDSTATLKGAGLQPTPANLFALHRFGPAGGVALLNAPAEMPTTDWVKSIKWGAGVSPDAVISQNRLDRYSNVGDMRNRFINGQIGAAPTWQGEGDPAPAPPVATPAAVEPVRAALTPPMPALDDGLAAMFAKPDHGKKRKRDQQRKMALFG